MKREFLINIVFLITVNLLIKPFYIFGIDRGVQNTVEDGAYGIYFALFNFTYLLQIINDFGLQNFNNREIAQHNQLIGKYLPNILSLKFILAFIYLLLVFGFALLTGYEAIYYQLLLFIALNQILASLVLFLRSNISALGKYRWDSLLSIVDRLILIFVCGFLLRSPVFKNQFQIEWFVYAQTAAYACTALLCLFLIGRAAGKLRWRFKAVLSLSLLRQSLPYALVIFLMTVYTRMDAVMIERLLPNGKIEADLYASAYRLLDASNMFGYLFAGLLLPMFAKMLKQGTPLGYFIQMSLQFIMAGAISLAIAVFFFGPTVKLGGRYIR